MGSRIVFMGAGAVGGYVGGFMAKAGEDVTLIDPWPEHIDTIKRDGLLLVNSQGETRVRVNALHLHEVQSLHKTPVDIAVICTKSYDTEWATAMMKQYLAADGFVVTMQNGLNEEAIAGVVGWGRVMGCIASSIGVNAVAPGKVVRAVAEGGAEHTVFHVGEVHGRVTPRAQHFASLLQNVDSADVTPNLWGERWSKLAINCMYNGLSAATGLPTRSIIENDKARRVAIRQAGEAVAVGQALGFTIEPIRKKSPEIWIAAAAGDKAALAEAEESILAQLARVKSESRPSTGQDMVKGRRTEIDGINGIVAQKGAEVGIATPANTAIVKLVKRVECGELPASGDNIQYL